MDLSLSRPKWSEFTTSILSLVACRCFVFGFSKDDDNDAERDEN